MIVMIGTCNGYNTRHIRELARRSSTLRIIGRDLLEGGSLRLRFIILSHTRGDSIFSLGGGVGALAIAVAVVNVRRGRGSQLFAITKQDLGRP